MISQSPWQIVPLADFPEAIPTLARWFYAEWSSIDGRSEAEIVEQLRQNLHRDRTPITFLAIRDGDVVATISLDEGDLPRCDHLTPWLASLYVVPAARRLGIGAALVTHLLRFADTQRFERIHLWTAGSTALYERFGWRLLDRTTYASQPIVIMERTANAAALPQLEPDGASPP